MFTTLFYQPILNLLVFLYNITGQEIGLAIILLTALIKLILWPLSGKALKAQKDMQALQPKLDEIKKKHKDNKEQQTKEMMALYKKEKINPFSSCLPLLIQLPFFWAIFRVFRDELSGQVSDLIYPFVHNPGALDPIAFGFIDLSVSLWYLAVLAAAAQFVQAKMLPKKQPAVQTKGSKDESMSAIMNKQMTYFMPIITLIICLQLPSGLAFYWFLTTVFTVVQQMIIFKNDDDDDNKEGVVEGEVVKQK